MLSKLRIKPERSWLLAFFASLCWFAQGMGQANFGNSTDLPMFIKHFPSIDSKAPGLPPDVKSHRSLMVGVVTSVYEIGLAFGGLSTYIMGDWLGRKRMTHLAATVVVIGVAIQASSFHIAQLYVGRVVAGLGIGAFTATVPAWVTETVSPKKRGIFIFLGGGFAITSISMISWSMLGLFIHQKYNEISWRLPLILQGVVAIIVNVGTLFLDESPRTLVRKGKPDQAYQVMKKTRNEKELLSLDEEYQEMIQAYENELLNENKKNPWAFNEHKQFRRTVSAIVLSALCQLAGINLITFYGARIFQDVGLNATKSRIALAGLQTWQAICAFAAGWFVNRFGRRNLLLGGSATMCICFCCCAGLASSDKQSAKYAILAFDAIQLAAFPIGLFLNPFLIASEIAGLLCRSAVLACVSFSNWVMNFTLAIATPIGFDNIGYKYYIVYICTNAALFVFSYLFIPDTSRLTVEEIDQAYVNSQHPLDIVKCADNVRAAGHIAVEPIQFDEDKKDDSRGSVMMIEKLES